MADQPAGPRYFGSGSIDWRRAIKASVPSARTLCGLVASHTVVLLENLGVENSEDLNLGVAFPGPQANGLWFSNNLTEDFRNGVPLRVLLEEAFLRHRGVQCARTVIVLDAQADAGGELYHSNGAFAESEKAKRGCVLNVATGIAAGFVDAGYRLGVLNTNKEFDAATSGSFDDGGGQLGRHLFVSADGEWSYHYRPQGQMAVDVDGVRMTDYLSGPALTARLALDLTRRNERLGDGGEESNWVQREAGRFCGHNIAAQDPGTSLRELGNLIRSNQKPVSKSVLAWADRALEDRGTTISLREALKAFREAVAGDFGRALRALQHRHEWERYSLNIVLTGGVGQNLFARSDHSFISSIGAFLRPGTALVRSHLVGGGERIAWFFHLGVFR